MSQSSRSEAVRLVAAFALGTALYWAATRGSLWCFPGTWFYEAGPGASPPWYFIGQDHVESLWAAGGFILLCVFTALASRHLGPPVWAGFAVNAVSFISRIGVGVNVWLNTSGLSSARRATSRWTTFDEYLASRALAHDVSLACAVVVMVGALSLYARDLQRDRTAL